jgi:hypothetical protein
VALLEHGQELGGVEALARKLLGVVVWTWRGGGGGVLCV